MNRFLIPAFLLVLGSTVLLSTSIADDTGRGYLLRYKLNAGEQLHYEVTHVAKTKTRINGSEDVSQVHTISKRHWDVTAASAKEATFDHVIDSVEMTQQQGDADELRWNSKDGEKPPVMFSKVAERLGKTLSTLTVTPQGKETARKDNGASKASLGMGSLTLSLPEKKIKVGEEWSVPREIKTRTEDGLVKPIKIRELYTLEKVETGVATISVRSEPLTPILDQSVKAQVVQQLSNGEIRFDIDNGRMMDKQLDWDESVVGFQGPASMMEYRARMSETLVNTVVKTAKLPKKVK